MHLFTLVTAIFYHFLATEADHPIPQLICIENMIYAQVLIFWCPAFKQKIEYKISNHNCLQMCSSCPSLKWKQFFLNADINVQSVDILLLKYTPDLPSTSG